MKLITSHITEAAPFLLFISSKQTKITIQRTWVSKQINYNFPTIKQLRQLLIKLASNVKLGTNLKKFPTVLKVLVDTKMERERDLDHQIMCN